MSDFSKLRAKRLRNRVSKIQLARKLGCAESWLNALELGHYRAPAREVWAEKYQAALDELIAEKRASGR